MAAAALGRLNNDVAAFKLDSCVLAAHGNAKFGALIHLHHGAIAQAQHGMRSAAGTNFLAFRDFITYFEWLVTAITHAGQYTVQRFHTGAHALRAGKEFVLRKVSCDRENDNCSGGSHPTETGICDLRKLLLPRRHSVAVTFAGFGFPAASGALMQVRFHE